MKNKMEQQAKKPKRKASFIRYNFHLKKLSKNWRSQTGIHNKVRLKKKGHPRSPSIGYGNTSNLKGLYKSELKYKIIKSEDDLFALNSENVFISSSLGLRKKLKLLELLRQKNIKIINIKDIGSYINNVNEQMKTKKQGKLAKRQKKQEMQKKTEELKAKKENKGLTQEEKEEKEKLEKKKILEKPQ